MPTTAATDADARGLTTAQVEERRRAGKVNVQPTKTGRSFGDIVRANVLTRFNAIITALAIVILLVGEGIDMLFAGVMVVNTVIGITQEVRAKRTLDRLRVLVAPHVVVRRDGAEVEVDPATVVEDDVVLLRTGDQVPVDALVVHADGLEVDESALTGESEPIAKDAGDEVLSGSAVVAGSATVVAARVGEEAWIHRLLEQAKEFSLATSELRALTDRILMIVSWVIVPLAALLLWSQWRSDQEWDDALVSTVAGVVALVPQGLVLLVSMALAVATIRLARNSVVVQELHAVEGLARVDVLCLDKTGTLTTGTIHLDRIEPLGSDDEQLRGGLAALAAAEPTPTTTMQLVAREVPPAPDWQPTQNVAFSSARKWSATSFDGHGTWIMGAPEIVLAGRDGEPAMDAGRRAEAAMTEGGRVLLVATSAADLAGEELPAELTPAGLMVLKEEVRPDASETLAYFGRQHVGVKVISGDSPRTVGAVADRLGLDVGDRRIDMRDVGDDQIDGVVEDHVVFGRVKPEQKRLLVDALQRRGHVVAMTGDGVNDIPALKRCDIGIAVDTATPATKAVAQLVLLDGRFDRLPHVVAEGRRVIANMERVSALFVTKTVYAALFALAIGISGDAFPFLPRHMSLVSELTIGVPAFVLSFRAADAPIRPGSMQRVLRFAVPAGICAAVVTLATYWAVREGPVESSLAEARSTSTLALGLVGLWVLYRLVLPVDRTEGTLLVSIAVLFTAVVTIPWTADLYAIEWPEWRAVAMALAITIGCLVAFEVALRVRERARTT